MIILTILLILIFFCWGSFLNAFAYRLMINKSIITKRSACPHCNQPLLWYDLIPVLSFIILKGKCRFCKKSISWLYPFIEVITALSFYLIIICTPSTYWLAYMIFCSALIVNTRTDLQMMVIPRCTSLYLAPIGPLLACLKLLPITLLQSILGGVCGYFILWTIAKIFFYIKKEQGMGEGDFELMALIGSFTGIIGTLASLFWSSIIGSIIGISLIITGKGTRLTKLPFGPLLAFGALMYILWPQLLTILVGNSSSF